MIPVVIPAKPLDAALGRLSAVLGAPERRTLQSAMLEDVLAAASGFSDRVVVVTGDPGVARLARSRGAAVVPDAAPRAGINAAVSRGLEAAGDGPALIVMGDLPCATAGDLHQVASARPTGRGVVAAVSGDGTGTNALLLSPARVIRPAFGAGSLARHLAAAEAAGVEATVVTAPGLMLDVDTAEDLQVLAAAEPAPHTRRLLATLGLDERLAPVVR